MSDKLQTNRKKRRIVDKLFHKVQNSDKVAHKLEQFLLKKYKANSIEELENLVKTTSQKPIVK